MRTTLIIASNYKSSIFYHPMSVLLRHERPATILFIFLSNLLARNFFYLLTFTHTNANVMNIGKNLQIIRELNNYTQTYMAERLGISQKSYSNLERAENDITVDVLLKVADIYQISLAKMLELNAEAILNNNSQQGGISYINNQATFYNGEKEEFQLLLRSQSELILAQQQMIRDLQK